MARQKIRRLLWLFAATSLFSFIRVREQKISKRSEMDNPSLQYAVPFKFFEPIPIPFDPPSEDCQSISTSYRT